MPRPPSHMTCTLLLHLQSPRLNLQRYQIKELVRNSPNKSCESDLIPTYVVKPCIDELLPSISCVINLSITSRYVPQSSQNRKVQITPIKEALVEPKPKKLKTNPVLKNYCPLNNLVYISKLTEKVVAKQIVHHLIT